MEEIFTKLNGFENYSISNSGMVRNDKTGKILKLSNCLDYRIVFLKNNENKFVLKGVLTLIDEVFIPNPDHSKIPSINTPGAKGVSRHLKNKNWNATINDTSKAINLNGLNFTNSTYDVRTNTTKKNGACSAPNKI